MVRVVARLAIAIWKAEVAQQYRVRRRRPVLPIDRALAVGVRSGSELAAATACSGRVNLQTLLPPFARKQGRREDPAPANGHRLRNWRGARASPAARLRLLSS